MAYKFIYEKEDKRLICLDKTGATDATAEVSKLC